MKKIFSNDKNNIGQPLYKTIEDALAKFDDNAAGKVIVIFTDGYLKETAKDKAALQKAEEEGVKVITVIPSVDEWDIPIFGTTLEPTTGILYNFTYENIVFYAKEMVLEDILLELEKVLPNLADAKDVQVSHKYYKQSGLVTDGDGRKRNIDYSSTMVNKNAEVLDVDKIKGTKDKKDKEAMIKELADNTKVSAITPNRNITFLHDNDRSKDVNMGLVERPKVQLSVEEKVDYIQVKLASGEVIVDTSKDKKQNVQYIPNDKYTVFMDKEIMQGATLTVVYKIEVTNNGHIDTWGDYFTYDMFNEEETKLATTSITTLIGTLHDYYTNNTFRAEDNSNIEIEINDVKLLNMDNKGITIDDWEEFIDKKNDNNVVFPRISTTTRMQEDGQAAVVKPTVDWTDSDSIELNKDVEKYIDKDEIKIAETKSLREVPLFPSISKEARGKTGVASISFRIVYSKQLSADDKTDMLHYENSIEIVERLNAVGRRDYIAVVGNYMPHDENITEYDADVAEDVIVMPPFGEDKDYTFYIVLGISSIIVLMAGVVFIKRKVL